MPSQYHPQLGDLIKSMLCKRPEDRPDVKHILRQPYIKRQIAMFLEATKEAGISPMATISSINIDLPSQQNDDVVKKQVQRPPSVKRSREPVARIVHRDSKVRGKPDPSPPASPVNPPVGAASGVCGRGGHQRTASNGLLDIQPNPCGACPVSVEKPDSDVDSKDDTSELLQEASVQSSNAENIVVDVGNKNDAVTLITRAPANLRTPDVLDSLETTEKLLEPPAVVSNKPFPK
ncbi:hypothetical protein XENOCAPTIV_010625 [Xenoophorus captivus]|uniref:Protein kinase domain-containing protein n=1 Tax=Xenoophorus captivus TaxID=1517983 RepID=A0ABV0Q4T9_9TELE